MVDFTDDFFNTIVDWKSKDIAIQKNAIGVQDKSPTHATQEVALQKIQEVIENKKELQNILSKRSWNEISTFSQNIRTIIQKPLPEIFSHLNEQRSDLDRFGNKAKHLIEMQQFLKGATIPSLSPFSHEEILSHLQKYMDLKGLWDDFKKAQGNASTLTEQGRAILKNIRTQIGAVFKQHPLESEALKKWVTKVPEGMVVTVRSTGKEDTKSAANAGGNETLIAFPQIANISEQCGGVIASYFSEKSLEQRLLAGDNILTEPFLPVLVQVLIGETKNEIPVSFVMYTSEAEAETSGVVHIQSCYGHGQGIVNSEVLFDSFYLYDDGVVHSIVAKKEERLIPQTEANSPNLTIQKIKNSDERVNQSSLSPDSLAKLATIAKQIEDYYEGPTDVEGVYLPSTNQIYIVQARPLVPTEKNSVNFVNLQQIPKEKREMVDGKLISEGDGGVKLVQDKDEIIQAQTLENALNVYLDPKFDKKKVKAILVKTMAATTSHAATTFRGEGMPILMVKDDVEAKIPFLLDIQRAKLILLSPLVRDAKLIDREQLEKVITDLNLIQSGRINYPIATEQSLSKPLRKQMIRAMNDYLQSAQSSPHWGEIHQLRLQEKIDAISGVEDIEKARLSAASLAKNLLDVSMKNPHYLGKSSLIVLNALAAIKEIDAALLQYRLKSDPQTLKRVLLGKKWLETVILQNSSERVLNSLSFVQFLNEMKQTQMAEKIWSQNPQTSSATNPISDSEALELFTQYLKAKGTAFTPELQQKWENFTLQLAKSRSPELNQRMIELLKNVQKLNIMPVFMQLTFEPAWENATQDPEKTLGLLEKDLTAIAPTIEQIKKGKAELEVWERRLPNWQDLEFHNKNWEEFDKFLSSVVIRDNWIEKVKDPSVPKLEKNLILKFIQDATELMDSSIKSMKSSTTIDPKTKATLFKNMLKPYHALMHAWVNAIPEEQFKSWYPTSIYVPQKFMLENIANSFNGKRADPKQLYPSGEFSVANAVIGSGASFARGFMGRRSISLEDLFTLFHQNILRATSAFQQLNSISSKQLPDALRKLDDSLTNNPYYSEIKSNLIGIDSNAFPILKMHFNIPLLNHSCTVIADYNTKTQKIDMTVEVLGEQRQGRLYHSSVWGALVCLCYNIPLKKLPEMEVMRGSLSFSLNPPYDPKIFKQVHKIVDTMACESFAEGRIATSSFPKFLELLKNENLNSALFDNLKNVDSGFFKIFSEFGVEDQYLESIVPFLINGLLDTGQKQKALDIIKMYPDVRSQIDLSKFPELS